MNRLAVGLLILSACTPSATELSVDVLTDFVPVAEFDAVQLELDGELVFTGLPSGDWTRGVRLADLSAEQGDRRLRARLLQGGVTLIERDVLVLLNGPRGVTIPLARGCRDVDCASGGMQLACVNEECVDSRCTPETPEFCGTASCRADAECVDGLMCGTGRCALGACLVVDDGRCGTGLYCDPAAGCTLFPGTDAGTDAGADSGTDAGPDAAPDAGMDTTGDAGDPCEYPPFGCLEPSQYVETGLDRGGAGTTTVSLFRHSDMPTGDMTWEMWVRFLTPPVGDAHLAGNSNAGRGFRMSVNGATFTYTVNGTPFNVAAGPLADGSWHHFAMTRTTGNLCVWIDGAMTGCNAAYFGQVPVSDIERIFIGRDNPGDTPNAHVGVHHLRIWSVVRTPEQIQRFRFRPIVPAGPDLVSEFTMQSTTVVDGVVELTHFGPIEGTLGWWDAPRGTSPGVIVPF